MAKHWRCLIAFFICSILFRVASAQEPRDLSHLTEFEQSWLEGHKIIRVAPTPDYPPFEYWDEQGNFQGVVSSYLKHFENVLGIKFQMVRTKQWEENLRML